MDYTKYTKPKLWANVISAVLLGMLVLLIHSIVIKGPTALNIFFLFCVIAFGGILILTVQNLRRLDKR